MPTLILMVGLPGAGKTTLARQIERDRPALRLTPDVWMSAMGIDGFDEPARARVEALQWSLAARCLELGVDVILDFGFWSREERDDYRARAAALGAAFEITFVDAPREELIRRLSERREPGTFVVSPEQLDEYIDLFEPPAAEELE